MTHEKGFAYLSFGPWQVAYTNKVIMVNTCHCSLESWALLHQLLMLIIQRLQVALLREDNCSLCLVFLDSALRTFFFADFNKYPFPKIKPNPENNSFFLNSLRPCRKSLRLSVGLRIPNTMTFFLKRRSWSCQTLFTP